MYRLSPYFATRMKKCLQTGCCMQLGIFSFEYSMEQVNEQIEIAFPL